MVILTEEQNKSRILYGVFASGDLEKIKNTLEKSGIEQDKIDEYVKQKSEWRDFYDNVYIPEVEGKSGMYSYAEVDQALDEKVQKLNTLEIDIIDSCNANFGTYELSDETIDLLVGLTSENVKTEGEAIKRLTDKGLKEESIMEYNQVIFDVFGEEGEIFVNKESLIAEIVEKSSQYTSVAYNNFLDMAQKLDGELKNQHSNDSGAKKH